MRLKIVVLDGFTLNPGDLNWSKFEALGNLEIFDRTPPEAIVDRLHDADIALTNKTPLTAEVINQLPTLRYIGVLATGYNIVDTAAAGALGIPVTNTPSYGTQSVAQHTFALILELANHVGHHSRSAKTGEWSRCPDFCYWERPLTELAGLTLGLIGAGRIGSAVAHLAEAFGMKVITATRQAGRDGLNQVLRESDVLSLHCPLTPETNNLINAGTLALMKPTALLINTSRGQLVCDHDLATALAESRLAGAALDVLSQEPPPPDNPLFKAPHCIITPHNAWASHAARARLMESTFDNLQAFLSGQTRNVVNKATRDV
ncbi:MAG: D-2-hydroxyacid dehydrogenase [Opitutaceae bacterium]|nr:D-2-hydroxyacid dehydrogenase [Cephaloticoccus sp.]MCP5530399.1 D-2-hydroxyacid dehydrogenase [Opitutaceae bacterium]